MLTTVRGGFRLELFLIALLTAWVVSCGGETAPESDAAPAESSSAPAESDAGAADSAADYGKLPDAYPEDLPVYPNASSIVGLGIPGAATMVTFDTEDSMGDVLSFFQSGMSDQGWELVDESVSHLEATKGERKVTLRVSAADQGPGSNVVLSLEGS